MTYDPNQPAGQTPQWPNPQQPYYAPPPAMLAYVTPVQNPRPTAATVLSIIGIVLGSLWILAGLAGLLQLFFAVSMMRSIVPGGMGGFEEIIKVQALISIVGGLIGAALLAVSIGCLRLASWARRGIITVAIIDLLFIAIKLVITLAWTIPYQQQAMTTIATSSARATRVTAVSGSMAGVQMGLALGQALLMGAFPVVVLILMTKPRMKQAYDRQVY